MRVPLVDIAAQQREVADEVWRGLHEVFDRTAFVGGPAVAEFERRYAEHAGVQHCVGVANGTDALELALRAVGVPPGGEVVLPANTFIATAEAVARIGAVPVLVDVDPVHHLIDPDAVAAAVTPRTAAVVPVHLFGQAAPVELVVKQLPGGELPIVEDAAQSQGATRWGRATGSLGQVAATSFYPGKNLGAAGDAGAVLTDDGAVARTVRMLGGHGSERKYVHDLVGMNSRLDTVQAVVLLAKLARLDRWNDRRRAAAARYGDLLGDVPGIGLPATAEGNVHVWHLFVVAVDDRDHVLAELHAAGIGAGIHYPTPIHLTGAFAHLGLGRGAFPVAEAAADRILSLPLYPHITADQQEHVAQTLTGAVRA
jgi:dTDP-4-amino-4,6-dideoxygalactose transaminase